MNRNYEAVYGDRVSIHEDTQRLLGRDSQRNYRMAKVERDELQQRAKLQRSFANAVKAKSPSTSASLENLVCEAVALKSEIVTQPPTMVARPVQPMSDLRMLQRSPRADINTSAPQSPPSRLPRNPLTWSGHPSFRPVPADRPLPPTIPSALRSPKARICSTPPPRPHAPHLISDSPSPTKPGVKMIALRAERAKQLQYKQEAMARARNATRILCNPAASWTRDKHHRHRVRAKHQAEKSIRLASCKLHALRQDELDLAQRLNRKRRRCGERWAFCHDID
ncbi:hypothetical protein MMC07_003050 [Pseudocyphellaria aurata]|nr:hypothetical protein [Pseudocyphellaria aurata]